MHQNEIVLKAHMMNNIMSDHIDIMKNVFDEKIKRHAMKGL